MSWERRIVAGCSPTAALGSGWTGPTRGSEASFLLSAAGLPKRKVTLEVTRWQMPLKPLGYTVVSKGTRGPNFTVDLPVPNSGIWLLTKLTTRIGFQK